MVREALYYAIPMMAGAIVSLAVAALAWQRRPSPGASSLAPLCLAVALWGLTLAGRLITPGMEGMVLWHKAAVVAMAPIPVCWFIFAADHTGRQKLVTRRKIGALLVLPSITVLLAVTNEWHGFHWRELRIDTSGPFPVLLEEPAFWWWIDTFYQYSLALAGLMLLFRQFIRSPGLYRRQAGAMLVAGLITVSTDLAYVTGIRLSAQVNLTPMLFSVVCLVVFWGFYRYRLFDLVPAAKDAVFASMHDAVIVTDGLYRVIDLNPAAEKVLGLEVAHVLGEPAESFLALPLSEIEDGRVSGGPEILLGAYPDERDYQLQVSPWWDKRGVLRGKLIVLRDVSERKRAEQALRQAYGELEVRVEERTAELRLANEGLLRSQAQIRHLLSASPTVIYTRRSHGDLAFTFVSENVLSQLGYGGREFLEDSLWTSILHPEDEELVAEVARLRQRGAGSIEYRLLDKGGNYRWIHDEMRLLRDEGGAPGEIIGSWLDVTELRLIEDQLRQSQKMEAIGVLAGGIAHDFNNLLTAILGYSDLLMRTVTEEPQQSDIKEIRKAADRAAALTRQLLAFSRRQVMKPQVLDLNDVVHGLETMLGRLMGEDYQLVADLARRLGRIKADPGQLQQVCMNLVLNARDAMPKGGTITISTAEVELTSDFTRRNREAHPGSYLRLSVSDTGVGIDEKTRVRLFEPFFTTKGQRGTGLGLSMVYGIVSQSGGFIDVRTKVGEGTSFDIYLPRLEGVPQLAHVDLEEPGPVSAISGGAERVLVVEDEEAVRLLVAKALREQGYEVVEALDAEEALLVVGDQRPIDMMITDVVMPRMSGPQLAERISQERPELKVLFMSGYARERLGQEGVLDIAVPFLEKPFTTHALVSKVNELMTCRL